MQKVGFLGCGQMGGALIEGFLHAGYTNIIAHDRNPKNQEKLKRLNVYYCDSIPQLFENCEILIVAVQPKFLLYALEDNRECQKFSLIISVAAEILIKDIELKTTAKVARAMPNTACAICYSTTLITPGAKIFKTVGDIFEVPENQFDSGSILCSCQSAFAFRYVRAAQLAGIKLGFRYEEAARITASCLKGAMNVVLEGGDIDQEMNKVMTPGGWTIKGVCALEENGFTNSIIKGLEGCK